MAVKFPWDFHISPEKVPWVTNSVPWNFAMISTIAHDGVIP